MSVDRCLYIGNIASDMTESLLYELFLQAGPVEDVTLKDAFGFVTYEDEETIPYACALFEGISLFGRELIIRPRQNSKYEKMKIRSVPPFTSRSGRSTRDRESPYNSLTDGNSFRGQPYVDYSYNTQQGLHSPYMSPRFSSPLGDYQSAPIPMFPVFYPQSSPTWGLSSYCPDDRYQQTFCHSEYPRPYSAGCTSNRERSPLRSRRHYEYSTWSDRSYGDYHR